MGRVTWFEAIILGIVCGLFFPDQLVRVGGVQAEAAADQGRDQLPLDVGEVVVGVGDLQQEGAGGQPDAVGGRGLG